MQGCPSPGWSTVIPASPVEACGRTISSFRMVRSSKSTAWFASGKITPRSSEPPAATLRVIQSASVALASVLPSAVTSASTTP